MNQTEKICIFVGGRQMVVRMPSGDAAAPALPTLGEARPLLPAGTKVIPVHSVDGLHAAKVASWDDGGPGGLRAVEFRPLFSLFDAALFADCCKAKQMAYWDEQSHFCPVCGAPMRPHSDISKVCPRCGHVTWPPISPAIIVRVERGGDEILLVRARNFRGAHYGLVAGFVEPGESLEECVRREVREEVGLEISVPRYAGSQPWPFPSGLMVGFVAQYAGGDICVQEEELTDARFFRRGDLPALPDKMSIARRLIDEWAAPRPL